MAIRVKCACGAAYSVPDDAAGKVGTCKRCQSTFSIPARTSAVAKGPPPLPRKRPPASSSSNEELPPLLPGKEPPPQPSRQEPTAADASGGYDPQPKDPLWPRD